MTTHKKGGKLPVNQIETFLNQSYEKEPKEQVDDYKLVDKTDTTRTYWNGSQCVFVIRGTNPTISDWKNNLSYMMDDYKETPRFREAQNAYNKAVQNYGEKNISVVGHSQGGGSASFFPNSKEIITLNRAYKGERVPQNEYDIHATRDPVSALLNIRKPPHDIPIQSTSWNPLSNHSIDIMKLLNPNQMIGQGLFKENGLTDRQLYALCSHYKIPLKGIFTADELNSLDNGNYILNLNGQSHWVGLIKDNLGCYYFDSFGFPAQEEIEEMCGEYVWNDADIQDIQSSSCGFYVIAFLKFVHNKPNKGRLYTEFLKLFSGDTAKNERVLFSIL